MRVGLERSWGQLVAVAAAAETAVVEIDKRWLVVPCRPWRLGLVGSADQSS